jgi:hypothetical protein
LAKVRKACKSGRPISRCSGKLRRRLIARSNGLDARSPTRYCAPGWLPCGPSKPARKTESRFRCIFRVASACQLAEGSRWARAVCAASGAISGIYEIISKSSQRRQASQNETENCRAATPHPPARTRTWPRRPGPTCTGPQTSSGRAWCRPAGCPEQCGEKEQARQDDQHSESYGKPQLPAQRRGRRARGAGTFCWIVRRPTRPTSDARLIHSTRASSCWLVSTVGRPVRRGRDQSFLFT